MPFFITTFSLMFSRYMTFLGSYIYTRHIKIELIPFFDNGYDLHIDFWTKY